ncbi:hypothetical protein LCGC14_0767160 [marine sediment metagenome]|uniref:Uncharacterized protein n=1 Tax=marine sediment metagenome TaxID=412755 RepID=A0A0F9QJ66_9ZZZZ|nr:MAG: hypothetical protein Lokiarch_09880 [Candidatus Lokiarchaeum sp. GC14_75]
MKKKWLLNAIFITMITLTLSISFITGRNDYIRDRVDGCSCHTEIGSIFKIDTNMTDNVQNFRGSISTATSTSFDINITIMGFSAGTYFAWVFWQDDANIGEPVPDGSQNGTVSSWSSGDLMYKAFWASNNDPQTRTFSITAPSSTGSYHVYVRGVGFDGSNTRKTPEYTLIINVFGPDLDGFNLTNLIVVIVIIIGLICVLTVSLVIRKKYKNKKRI